MTNFDRYRGAFGHIRAPEGAALRAEEAAQGRRRGAWPRAALVAACLCVALLGGAVAAELSGVIQVTKFAGTLGEKEEEGFAVNGEWKFFPADSLSEEVNELAREHPRSDGWKGFFTWDEMEEFIGLELMDNPVLDEAYQGEVHVSGPYGSYSEPCLVEASSNSDGELTAVCAWAGYRFWPTERREDRFILTVRGRVYTDVFGAWREEDMDRTQMIVASENGMDYAQEPYVTPSGLETMIVRVNDSYYYAFFSLNGVQFVLDTAFGDMDLTLEVLKEVLDGVVY